MVWFIEFATIFTTFLGVIYTIFQYKALFYAHKFHISGDWVVLVAFRMLGADGVIIVIMHYFHLAENLHV